MKKTIIVTAAFAFVFSLAVAGISVAADAGPAELVLKTAAGKKPANFGHKKHQASLKCGDCHHGKAADGTKANYADGQAIGKCESCHNDTMKNEKLNSYMKAAHVNCKDCHKAEEAKGKAAPTKCTGCHPEAAGAGAGK